MSEGEVECWECGQRFPKGLSYEKGSAHFQGPCWSGILIEVEPIPPTNAQGKSSEEEKP